ncbi:Elf1-domain-containing protein [Sporormia fimetaria CBS 119925]|uniref:Transcription elongation factor 1 homolog n=1 Tax=Sporormia fimetaria CBS 119925 TaxID=1340428 RepID=A0A6A6UZ09_9PLEO|nr:Elf1-domain-containing protein [Sporormia fimetaria CBS 119925]
MGKRKKASKPQGPKKREKLPTSFQCLFCNHEGSVEVNIDRKAKVGDLSCKVCGQFYQTAINNLSAGVDVYADWIDACDAVAKEQEQATAARRPSGKPRAPPSASQAAHDDGLGDDFIVDDELDAEGEFADDDE